MSLFDDFWGGKPAEHMGKSLFESWECKQCGMKSYVGQPHYCGATPRTEGAKAVAPLTEAKVRDIVREELRNFVRAGGMTPAESPSTVGPNDGR